MKSIENTLATIRDIFLTLPIDIELALIGGYAAVLHGVERTTLDIDFCAFSDLLLSSHDSTILYDVLRKHLPERFESRLAQGTTIPDDPFRHDAIFIKDTQGEHFKIDILVARYKWELEAIRSAEHIEGIPVPVITKPYLAAMKLQASGYKDASDVVILMSLMSEKEKEKAFELAARTKKDRKLRRLLQPPDDSDHEDVPDELL